MKRVLLALVATITGLVVLLAFKTGSSGAGRPAALAPVSPGGGGSAAAPRSRPARAHRHPARRTPHPTATATSRTALGQTVATQYGPVQVKVTEVSGRITNVMPVQLPSQDSHSRSVAAYAAPRLRQEAIAADSAHIDIVSGATYTSDGYAQSLQSAIDQLRG